MRSCMGLLPDTQNCGIRMLRECQERIPRHRLQTNSLDSDPGMHYGTCVTHVPWCMSGSLTRDGGENVPGIPGACTTRNFAYLARGPWYGSYLFMYTLRLTQRAGDKALCHICSNLHSDRFHSIVKTTILFHLFGKLNMSASCYWIYCFSSYTRITFSIYSVRV